jgi:putative DNA primase/helicase
MQQDTTTLDIATGAMASTKKWRNEKMTWLSFAKLISKTVTTKETLKQFLSMSKEEQGIVKDQGAYFGGYLLKGSRLKENVVHKQLLTLDIDFAHTTFWEDFKFQFGNTAIIHGTHKHRDADPRLRLLMPLNRPCSPEEYVAVARYIAGIMGIDLFDDTTFDINRYMFFPSTPCDVDYYFEKQEGEWLDVDEVLGSYVDWRDTSSWKVSSRFNEALGHKKGKQQDPELKEGAIGAFCRTYSIEDTISEFLDDVYDLAEDGRYTYKHGSTSGGMVTYDGKFAFSHHGTDPSGGSLCNAFDLLRIHKFRHEDEGKQDKKASFTATQKFVLEIGEVKKTIAKEKIYSAKYDFSDSEIAFSEQSESDVDDVEWASDLEVDKAGLYKPTAFNFSTILSNDVRIKGAFRYNDFDKRVYVYQPLPWRNVTKGEVIKNVDEAGLRNYIETVYGIASPMKLSDAFEISQDKNKYHPVRDYLDGVVWDGKPRIDSVFNRYLGTEDNKYNSMAARKLFVGAVSRIMEPGVKFDLVVVFMGVEGVGKSTFIDKIGKGWYSDSFYTLQGKEAMEQTQGVWIMEMAELSGLSKAAEEAAKHFISKREDMYRPPFKKGVEIFPRQVIFVGTTNNFNFLKRGEVNRRYLPVKTNPNAACNIWTTLDSEVDQLWAEAVFMYKKREPNYVTREEESLMVETKSEHTEEDSDLGMVEEYVNQLFPENWMQMSHIAREMYLASSERSGVKRNEFAAIEVWTYCLGQEMGKYYRAHQLEMSKKLSQLDGWSKQEGGTKISMEGFGRQRYYSRIVPIGTEIEDRL